jgi:alkyldihydroxyacetonephosphate synthase
MVNPRGQAEFNGKRYEIGGQEMPLMRGWMEQKVGLDLSLTSFSQPHPSPDEIPPPLRCPEFVEEIHNSCLALSDEGADRLLRGHGHTCHELFALRMGKIGRIPDLVVWPGSHEHIVKIVEAAAKHDICLIPFGGGTNVSGALECPPEERRPIASVDTSEMDRILWLDEENLTAHVQCGVIGQDLERLLAERGYTCGHEPDSLEFSSVGGWVATRSSGMKKNVYGNIEDIVLRLRMVTPRGVVERGYLGPRNSMGPDIQHFILGSEGTLGFITEVTLRVRPLPEVRRYGSIVFHRFELGVQFMREVARQRCAPASIRLMDNEQFQLGQVMKPAPSVFGAFTNSLKKLYVTKFKGFGVDQMAACTLLLEGTSQEVAMQERKLYDIASRYGGLAGGEENGRRGYQMTFAIAYIRDLAFDYCYLAESFETSVPWSRVLELCRNVKDRVVRECERHGVNITKYPPLISARVTQTYDAGACVYFYLAFNYTGVSNPIAAFDEIEGSAREEILASGGSLSHHHGVGKLRRHWLPGALGPVAMDLLRAAKTSVDPHNIFGSRNLLPE